MKLFGTICLSDIDKSLIRKGSNGKSYLTIEVGGWQQRRQNWRVCDWRQRRQNNINALQAMSDDEYYEAFPEEKEVVQETPQIQD